MIYFTGLMAARPNDMLGIAYARTEISDDLAANVSDSGETTIIPSYEAVVEVSYTAQIIPGFAIQPDFQYLLESGRARGRCGRSGKGHSQHRCAGAAHHAQLLSLGGSASPSLAPAGQLR